MPPFEYRFPANLTNNIVGKILTGQVRASSTTSRSSESATSSNSVAEPRDTFGNGNTDPQVLQQSDFRKFAIANPPKRKKTVAAETRTKAAYLFKYMSLLEWRGESKETSLQVAVLGDPVLEREFRERFEGKNVRNKRIEFVQVKKPSDLKGLEMLYVNRKHPGADEFLEIARDNKHTLTVESLLRDKDQRSAVGFITLPRRVRFRINVDNVRHQQVKISPRLVKCASVLFKEDVAGNLVQR